MSTRRIADREQFRQPKELGPNGRGLCRYCKQEVPKGRQSWCSKECVEEYLIRTNPQFVRHKLLERDKGVCAECGTDTEAIRRELRRLRLRVRSNTRNTEKRERRLAEYNHHLASLRAAGFNVATWIDRTLWEADHIVPVVEGGGECGLDNYRTLCTPCHKRATAELARRRAEQRRREHNERMGILALPLAVEMIESPERPAPAMEAAR